MCVYIARGLALGSSPVALLLTSQLRPNSWLVWPWEHQEELYCTRHHVGGNYISLHALNTFTPFHCVRYYSWGVKNRPLLQTCTEESETKLLTVHHVRMKIALETLFCCLIGAAMCVSLLLCGYWALLYCACVRLERLQLQSGRWSAGHDRVLKGTKANSQ